MTLLLFQTFMEYYTKFNSVLIISILSRTTEGSFGTNGSADDGEVRRGR